MQENLYSNFIIRNINETAKNRIKGILRAGKEIKPFLFELETATHFLVSGFDVEFLDLENKCRQGSFDFLVQKNNIEAEVECKRKSVDAGRNITRQGFCLLSDLLVAKLVRVGKNCVVNIICKEELGKSHKKFQMVSASIQEAVFDGVTSVETEGDVIAQIHYLPDTIRIRSDQEAAKVLSPIWAPHAHFAVKSDDVCTLIIRVESEATDRVLSSIFEEMKKGSAQFSKTRPALLACFIEEIYDDDWESLRRNSGLVDMTAAFFISGKTGHVNTVAYSSDVDIDKAQSKDITMNLYFRNPQPKFKVPPDFFGFRDTLSSRLTG